MLRMRSLIQRMTRKKAASDDLGLGLPPGAPHYRAYVGPPADYDLVAAMTFNLLTTLGLRQHHSVLDVGCGSLRTGRLLIPYLNKGNYTGIEPNQWLVDRGIDEETGRDQLKIKCPRFHFADSARELPSSEPFDFAVAQSVFSHCGFDLLIRWLEEISARLKGTGALAATYLIGELDTTEKGWIYPWCVNYRTESMAACARKAGLQFSILDWKHPRQTWALFAKPDFDASWFRDRPLAWNTMLEYAPHRAAG